jgi:hypothetical protein
MLGIAASLAKQAGRAASRAVSEPLAFQNLTAHRVRRVAWPSLDRQPAANDDYVRSLH